MLSVPPLICASNKIGQPSVELLHGRARTNLPSRCRYRSGSQLNWALSSSSPFAAPNARWSDCSPESVLDSGSNSRADLPTANPPHISSRSSTNTLLGDCSGVPLSSHFSPDNVAIPAGAFEACAEGLAHTIKKAERNARSRNNISLSGNR